jgi:hypothetical protein
MMALSAQQVDDLKTIASWSEATMSAIKAAAEECEGNLADQAKIQDLIGPHCNLEMSKLNSISSAISGIFYAYIASGKKEDEFTEKFIASVADYGDSFTKNDLNNLKSNLLMIFAIVPLFVAHKAQTLVMNSERLMIDSRILTDIRPVFGQCQTDSILGYAISQTLKIDYRDSHGNGEFYVALDSSDLRSLKQIIDRALEKLEIIKTQSGISPKGFVRD